MPKSSESSSLPYDPPFRYTRPERDIQSVFGAQVGNPPILPAEAKPATNDRKRVKPAPRTATVPAKAAGLKAKVAKPAAKPKKQTTGVAAAKTKLKKMLRKR